MEPCIPGKPIKNYKRCRCMASCGAVERIYTPYDMNAINGLHLIAELYDDDSSGRRCGRFHLRWRTTWLTESYWAHRRHWILFPQSPYGDRGRPTKWTHKKLNYDNYLEGRDPRYWPWVMSWGGFTLQILLRKKDKTNNKKNKAEKGRKRQGIILIFFII